jgi:hypothetical protein
LLGLIMESRNRLWVLLMLVCLIWLVPAVGVAQAQEPLVIQEMYLSVWPEYYTPDVVVSQGAVFVNQSEEPVGGEIWFQLPKTVEPVNLSELQQGILPRYFEVVDKGDHQLIRYELTAPLEPGERLSLLLEYTYPRFQEAGRRQIPVEFISKYPVEKLVVEIKQPLRSTDFSIVPGTDSKFIDSEGFDVYQLDFSDVKADRLLEFQISYYKEDNLPSLDPEPATTVADEPQRQGMNSTTVGLLVIAFIAVLGITLVFALRSNQTAASPVKGNKTGADKKAAKVKPQKGATGKDEKVLEPVDQRKKLRKMLMEGKINEKTYEKLIAELDKNK